MTQNAKLSLKGSSLVDASCRSRLDLCGALDAQTRCSATTKSHRPRTSSLNSLISMFYAAPRFCLSRQLACTPLVRVCTTIERNEGCNHVSQKTYSQFPTHHHRDSFLRTRAGSTCTLCTCAICLDCLSRLAATPARHGAPSPSPAEGARTKHRASLLQRGCLRRNCFVRRPAQSLPSVRIPTWARSRRCFEHFSHGRPPRRTNDLQNFPSRRKRSAHGDPSSKPNGIARAHHSLRARRLDQARSRSCAATKPHVRECLQRSHRAKAGNSSFVSAASRSRRFSRLQIPN